MLEASALSRKTRCKQGTGARCWLGSSERLPLLEPGVDTAITDPTGQQLLLGMRLATKAPGLCVSTAVARPPGLAIVIDEPDAHSVTQQRTGSQARAGLWGLQSSVSNVLGD